MKTKLVLLFAIIGMLMLSACTSSPTQVIEDKEIVVAASIYPLAEIVEHIVGEKGEVISLVPVGSEPHSYEPSPKQIATVQKADLFVTVGLEFESIEDDVAQTLPSSSKVLVLSEHVELLEFDSEHHDEHEDEGHDEEETDAHGHGHDDDEEDSHAEDDHNEEVHVEDNHDDHDHGALDPHIWGSPQNMVVMTQIVLNEVKRIDPSNIAYYETNALAYIAELQALDLQFEETLASCQQEDIIVNHAAFGYLVHEYGLHQHAIAGFSPEVEPSALALAELIEEAEELGVKYIFFEELASDKVARTIALEVGAQVLELNPAGGAMLGEDYQSIMRDNLKNLELALECN